MVSTAGGIVIAIVVLLLAAAVGWIGYTQVRARKLGLPPPSLASYLPWHKDSNYGGGGSSSSTGGVTGWFNTQVRKFKNRNNRSAAGAYEPSFAGAPAERNGAARGLDPDEAWDARVGNEADGYGYYGEELHDHHDRNEYGGGASAGNSYNMNVAATPGREADHNVDLERGRAKKNPFDDDNAADSLRGVSPRPMGPG